MTEYIRKKQALDAVENGCGLCGEEISEIKGIEIVFCKECIYFEKMKRLCVHSSGMIDPFGDGFCNYGRCKQ